MKTFYTVRDIEDMHAAGMVEIQTHDDVVVTDVAREKAIALGMRLVSAEENPPSSASPPSSAFSRKFASSGGTDADLIRKVKAGVIQRLGTDKYNDLLDQIIPQVMTRLKK